MKNFLLSLIIVTALAACGNNTDEQNTNKKPLIKIGATLPLTGNYAETGNSAKAAMLLALDKWKTKNTKYDYEILFEDDALKPAQATLNAQNFINLKEVKAIVSIFGIVDRPIDNIANQNHIISASCSYGKLQVPAYGFNTCVQNKQIADILIPKLKKENIRKIALVMANTVVSLSVGDYFADMLPQSGFEVVAYEKYNMDTRDMRLSILAMEEKHPDYYLTFAAAPLTDILVKQLKEVVNKRNIASLGTFTEMAPQMFPLVEGLWTIDTISGTDEFVKTFTDTTGYKVKSCTANSYDNIDLMIWAFENTPTKNEEIFPYNIDVINTIKKIKDWRGASGNLTFINGIASPSAHLRMYNGDKFVDIEE